MSPSGKATDSDSVIRWFESSYPSHFERYLQNLQISLIFYSFSGIFAHFNSQTISELRLFWGFFTPFLPDLGAIWEQKGEQIVVLRLIFRTFSVIYEVVCGGKPPLFLPPLNLNFGD